MTGRSEFITCPACDERVYSDKLSSHMRSPKCEAGKNRKRMQKLGMVPIHGQGSGALRDAGISDCPYVFDRYDRGHKDKNKYAPRWAVMIYQAYKALPYNERQLQQPTAKALLQECLANEEQRAAILALDNLDDWKVPVTTLLRDRVRACTNGETPMCADRVLIARDGHGCLDVHQTPQLPADWA